MIRIKREKIGNKVYHNHKLHYIYDGNKKIGEIEYKKVNKKLIICFLGIYLEYRNMGYGRKVIKHILDTHKVECIIGETLETSRGFWRKMIIEFDGCRKNINYNNNCTSSFVIPKKNISCDEVFDLLRIVDNTYY